MRVSRWEETDWDPCIIRRHARSGKRALVALYGGVLDCGIASIPPADFVMRIPRLLASPATLGGIAWGLSYGVVIRLMAETDVRWLAGLMSVMTIAFLFLVPIAIGYFTVLPVERPSIWYRLFVPWIPMTLSTAAVTVAGMEGLICIVMGLPLLLPLSSLGGLIGGASNPGSRTAPVLVAVLPLVVAPLESRWEAPVRLQDNVTEIVVEAPPAVVWQQVVSVDSIQPEERRPALFTRLGFPAPVSATVDGTGVGAVRLARFEGGVVFIETVTDWQEGRRLSFTIDPQTDAIPATTLDPHVTIGGPFFDVLSGTYELHPLDGGRTRVVLTSQHRVSTHFNFYAGLWGGLVMRSIQDNILVVIRDRAEAAAREVP
jgi:hypothetical protein